MTGFATNFRLHAVFFRTLFTFVCKSFGLLFSDVLIFYPHCLLFSCIQLNSASLYFTVCIRPIRLRRNIPPQASLQLSFLLFRQCSLFIKISFCMKFSRYKSHYSPPYSMAYCFRVNGDGEIRTLDPLLARQVLSQLSYTPIMGLSGLEPPTSRLSGVRSNRLSYKPIFIPAATCFPMPSPT